MDDFKPTPKYSIGELTLELEFLMEKINALEKETKSVLAQTKEKRPKMSCFKKRKENHQLLIKVAKNNQRLKVMHQQKKKLQKEIENMANGITQLHTFADEAPIPYNECVGSCYGKDIFVNDSGELLYREAEEENAIGITIWDYENLKPLRDLPPSERDMIMAYLKDEKETPIWVKL